ncbi:hypothetical protein K435DRAFT_837938 [Dendrothele bispora CBS 962.96]|uniref:Uncharacterized protein n=1 Tax=Dendrothele bispora (strain CBS 962.96) TaxID=1314807 RepID=A0A4S8M8W2_DENBC|nr:hypothetical protein K435DRAFT_837938 [Dendrothele bispora CBS 962.96]
MGPIQGIHLVTVLKTQRRAYPTHKTSNTAGTTSTVSTPGFLYIILLNIALTTCTILR